MTIIWTDTNLKRHEIDLSDAVDVKIDGTSISTINDGIRIKTDGQLIVIAVASNAVDIKEVNF